MPLIDSILGDPNKSDNDKSENKMRSMVKKASKTLGQSGMFMSLLIMSDQVGNGEHYWHQRTEN